jgi:hypothetical protein
LRLRLAASNPRQSAAIRQLDFPAFGMDLRGTLARANLLVVSVSHLPRAGFVTTKPAILRVF